MDPGSIIQLCILVLLLFLSGFFSSAETALTTVSLNKLKVVLDEGGRRGKKAKLVINMRENSAKNQNSLTLSLAFSKPIYILMIILTPVIWLLNKICRGVFCLLRVDPDANPDQMTETELLKIVDVSSEEGVIENSEKKMINNVVDFGDAISKDIMIPRADMVCIDINISHEELKKLIEEENYSRYPVYDESKDHITGILW